jgi:hypothetical protein
MRFFVVASLLLLAALVAAGPHRVQSEDCGESGGPVPTPTGDSGDSGYTPSPSPSLESYAARGLPTSNDSVRPSSPIMMTPTPSFVPIAICLCLTDLIKIVLA